MKKIIHLIALAFFIHPVFSQTGTINVSINSDTMLSPHLSDWDDDTSYLNLVITNNLIDQQQVRIHTELFSYDQTQLMYSSYDIKVDTLPLGTNTFDFSYFCPEVFSVYSSHMVNMIESKGHLDPGNYQLIVTVHDTALSVDYDSDTITFDVDSVKPPSLLFPEEDVFMGYDLIDSLTFKWTAVDVDSLIPVMYIFRAYNHIPIHSKEYILENFSPFFTDTIMYSTEWLNTSFINQLGINQEYLWTIEAKSVLSGEPLGWNRGKSVPFRFKVSDNNQDDAFKHKKAEDCFFGGFEAETFQEEGWEGMIGSVKVKDVWHKNKFNMGSGFTVPSRQDIETSGTDQLVNELQMVPYGSGLRVARIGNSSGGKGAESIKKTFTVTNSNAHFTIRFAAILQHGGSGHNESSQPTFVFRSYLKDEYKKRRLIESASFSLISQNSKYAQVRDITWFGNPSKVDFYDWNCFAINLSEYIGETVTIEVLSGDCTPGAHFGYGYFDICTNDEPLVSFSTTADTACIEGSIVANNNNSLNVTDYFWEIFRSDETGNEISLIHKTPENIFDIKSIDVSSTINKYSTIKCNSWYKIKLHGKNGCSEYQTESKLVYYKCVETDLGGSDKCCPNWDCLLALGSTAKTGYAYEWYGPFWQTSQWEDAVSNKYIANPVFNSTLLQSYPQSGTPIIYILKTTDNFGCIGYDEVNIYNGPPSFSLIVDTIDCGYLIYPDIGQKENYTYNWEITSPTPESLGSASSLKVSPNETTTYSLSLTNLCGASTKSITLNPRTVLFGPIDTLFFDNIVATNEDFVIQYWNRTNPNSRYNATSWEIEYLGRWGESDFFTNDPPVASGASSNGFPNGDIKWDLKIGGKRLIKGTYALRINIQNCTKLESPKFHEEYDLMSGQYQCRGDQKLIWKGTYQKHILNGLPSDAECYQRVFGNWEDKSICNKADKSNGRSDFPLLPYRECVCTDKHDVRPLVPVIVPRKISHIFPITVE